ncbi:uncharacterized protein LOC106089570 isoform X2 [Stomoxys calcitrans]|uniref:C-type lectin domain-containing protein n=1 Tax=Stomoxys calcitrans TaxID=35570 RepID=A0A1I8NN04_STOCA|nr:uncharacterized protein LOC106089570 isoform X2 [Stomoxys calcitrans]
MKMKVRKQRFLITLVCNRRTANDKSKCPRLVSIWCCAVVFMCLANVILCNNVNNDSENIKYANESLSILGEVLNEDASDDMIWSHLLEDYVLRSNRASKDLQFFTEMAGGSSPTPPYQMMMNPGMGPNPPNPQPPLNYHSSAYKRPTTNVFINKRIGEVGVELEPHKRPPVQMVNPQFRPMTNQMGHSQPSFLQQIFGGTGSGGNQSPMPTTQQQHMRPVPLQSQHGHGNPPQTFRAVSENDLYLLGAIEKLVYRVDYLESRVRRTEQLIYYLMAGNKQQEVRDPCPTNFTRISENCYYINSYQQVNWKTANSACKALNSHLAEFERVSENEEIMAYLLNQPNHRGRDYWLGGLNPGLLWIWSNSAKPVNPNMNLTSIAMSHKESSPDKDAESNIIDGEKEESASKDGSILNNTLEIEGQGRCLRLAYNTAKHAYNYHGQECTTRQNYICEHEDKTLDNKIKKIARDLKLF